MASGPGPLSKGHQPAPAFFADPLLKPFTVTSSTDVRSSGKMLDRGLKTTSAKTTHPVINVSDSGELLSLLDRAEPGADGKITISGSKNTSNSSNSSRINTAGRLNADHGAMDIRRMRDRSAIDLRLGGGKRAL